MFALQSIAETIPKEKFNFSQNQSNNILKKNYFWVSDLLRKANFYLKFKAFNQNISSSLQPTLTLHKTNCLTTTNSDL